MHREPARRFRQQRAQEQRQDRRQRADVEHPLPAEMRHHPERGQADRHEPDRKHQLVEQHEAAAILRARQLADVGRGDRHLAAEADALQGAEPEQRVVVPGERADEAHHPEHRDRADHRRHAAVALADPAEQQGADQLADIAGRDHEADVRAGELPHRHQHRQHGGDGDGVEGVEECGDADDDPRLDVPPRGGQPLDPRDDVIDGAGRRRGTHAHGVLPRSILRQFYQCYIVLSQAPRLVSAAAFLA